MLGQTSMASENHPLPLQVETDQTALSQDVASGRSTRFLWTGFGFAALMLIGLWAPANVITPNHNFAFSWAVPGSLLRGMSPRSNSPPGAPIGYPVYSGEKRRVGPRLNLIKKNSADMETSSKGGVTPGAQKKYPIDRIKHPIRNMDKRRVGPRMDFSKEDSVADMEIAHYDGQPERTKTSTNEGLIHEVEGYADFKRLVEETSGDDSVLVVKFYFKGCSACRAMAPRFLKFSKDYAGKKIRFAQVEIKVHAGIGRKFGVSKTPAVHFYVDSKKEEDFLCGPKKVNILKERLDDYNENGIAAVAHSTMHDTDIAP